MDDDGYLAEYSRLKNERFSAVGSLCMLYSVRWELCTEEQVMYVRNRIRELEAKRRDLESVIKPMEPRVKQIFDQREAVKTVEKFNEFVEHSNEQIRAMQNMSKISHNHEI